MNETPSPLEKALRRLASMKVTVVGLFLLLILTIWGTLYQTENGLYQAQVRFYQSWYFLALGLIPFPGAKLVMSLLIINLSASIALFTLIKKLNTGFLLTHAGLLMMLVAGAVLFYFGEESNLMLEENETSNVSVQYRKWELAVYSGSGNVRKMSAVDLDGLKPGKSVSIPEKGLTIQVESVFENCNPSRQEDPAFADCVNASGYRSIQSAKRSGVPEENRPGLVFRVVPDLGEPTRLLLAGMEPRNTSIQAGGEELGFTLRRRRCVLPAAIRLIDFKREVYPGTQIPKSFSSRVSIEGLGMPREVVISMNKPLRLGGYTFFQSSYQERGGRESSTLAVVKNYGRTLPYWATGITFFGMVVHFIGVLVRRSKRQSGPRKTEVSHA